MAYLTLTGRLLLPGTGTYIQWCGQQQPYNRSAIRDKACSSVGKRQKYIRHSLNLVVSLTLGPSQWCLSSSSCYLVYVHALSWMAPTTFHFNLWLPSEQIYDLGLMHNWRVFMERPLISNSAPRFVLFPCINEMNWDLNSNFQWPELNPVMLQRGCGRSITLTSTCKISFVLS